MTTAPSGAEGCARQIARFGSCGCNGDFPVVCLKITPKSRKFAQPYTHRDLLGALLSLGIERSAIGDLIVGEDCSYAFCLARIAPYLCENLTSVRHTDVVCTLTEERPKIANERRSERVTLSSLRCDVTVCRRRLRRPLFCVCGGAAHTGKSSSTAYFPLRVSPPHSPT